ncbi:MAG: ABC transporter permease [Leptospiraceae bacterium]|nr:ABC transporter permease [Leptospiraceae bacterium]
MIEVHHLSKSYKPGTEEIKVLNDVSLSIEEGEFVAIMGASGSGKSTLLQILGLLDIPNPGGKYKLFGENVAGFSDAKLAELRAKSIGFVFQQFHLLSRTIAVENVSLPSIYSGLENAGERARSLLALVGLEDRIEHRPNELSGGQQQRVAIARALINSPKIIFADEPTGNLDSKSKKDIMELLVKLNQSGITIVMVTHEQEIAEYCSRMISFSDGKVLEDKKNTIKQTNNKLPKGTTDILNYKKPGIFKTIRLHLYYAIKTFLANKIRTTLSTIGILIGVSALIVVMALGEGAKKSIEKRLLSLGSNLLILKSGAKKQAGVSMEAGLVTRLSYEDGLAIQTSIPEVARLSSTVSGRAQAVFQNKNWNTNIIGVEAKYAAMRSLNVLEGRFINEAEDKDRKRLAVLGHRVNQELFGTGYAVGKYIKVNRTHFKIIGVLPEVGGSNWKDPDDVILVPLQTAMHRLFKKDLVDRIEIEIRKTEEIKQAEEKILSLMYKRHRLSENSGKMFEVKNMSDIQEALSESSKTMSMLLFGVATISLLVGGIGIMNIMLVSVKERTREIGLRKALGAKKEDILLQFLIESVLISLFGGFAGIILGRLISYFLTFWAKWTTSVSPEAIFFAFLFSSITGILFGIWPARIASNLDPITALRYE